MTTRATFTIGCTDEGRHGWLTLFELIVRDDGSLDEVEGRMAPFNVPGARHIVAPTEDGSVTTFPAPETRTVEVPTAQETIEGTSEKWRRRCPKCGTDNPINAANMKKLVSGFRAAGKHSFDISHWR